MNDNNLLLIVNEILSPAKNIFHYQRFSKMSQFTKYNAHKYRKRASKQEVKIIPPFQHLHKEFNPNISLIYKQKDEEYIEQIIDKVINNNGNNKDIAEKICIRYDGKFKDTNTIVIVSDMNDIYRPPQIVYERKIDFKGKYINIKNKYVFIYHIESAFHVVKYDIVIKKDKFDEFVRNLAMIYKKPCQIANRLDIRFGNGFNVAIGNHDKFYVYCRFNCQYNTCILLPNGQFVVVWRT
eukprot:520758_1